MVGYRTRTTNRSGKAPSSVYVTSQHPWAGKSGPSSRETDVSVRVRSDCLPLYHAHAVKLTGLVLHMTSFQPVWRDLVVKSSDDLAVIGKHDPHSLVTEPVRSLEHFACCVGRARTIREELNRLGRRRHPYDGRMTFSCAGSCGTRCDEGAG